ncbi:radical SAM protein [Candidatus Woesearchaeota archaeon]|nr:radical SAM protein [Candidatus Woesearchaeota archaeon]
MEYHEIEVDSLLRRVERDTQFGHHYIMDLYEGCPSGCIYCLGKSAKYSDVPAGFFQNIRVKKNAPEILNKELLKAGTPKRISIGLGVNDTYQLVEGRYELTKKCIEICVHHGFPVHIMTKNDLVLRDVDLLKKAGAIVTFSFSTINQRLAKILEPDAPYVARRIEAIKELKRVGIPVGMALYPIMPYITDEEDMINRFFETAKELDVLYAIDSPLRLPEDMLPYFFDTMLQTPRLRRFLKRYQRLYKLREVPYGKVMQMINMNCYDAATHYGIARKIPD